MTRRVLFRPQASADIGEARRWYQRQQIDLGRKFTAALDDVMKRIAENAEAFPRVYGDTRRAVLDRFPYGIFFRIQGDAAVILGVIHGRRHPQRWQSRR